MKITITNPSQQHASVFYWRETKNDIRYATYDVPYRGGSVTVEIPTDQADHIIKQISDLGLQYEEAT